MTSGDTKNLKLQHLTPHCRSVHSSISSARSQVLKASGADESWMYPSRLLPEASGLVAAAAVSFLSQVLTVFDLAPKADLAELD